MTTPSAITGPLLLLDLDGVVVHECRAGEQRSLQVVLLHENLAERLTRLGMPVAVLTHRSRREAMLILRAAGLTEAAFVAVFAAEDLILAGLRHAPHEVLRRGLRKDFVLPLLTRRFGVAPADVAFVDDLAVNLDDMSADGLGLTLHAPAQVLDAPLRVVSFDFDEVTSMLVRWQRGELAGRSALRPVEFSPSTWRLTGLSTQRAGNHLLNRLRRAARGVRQVVF